MVKNALKLITLLKSVKCVYPKLLPKLGKNSKSEPQIIQFINSFYNKRE